ncbi:hypothetical protein JXB12_00860 [candidate division KSB1 bacterium]|nr:hypothetical protein [candidate division KSB1 bacterium]
MGNVVKLTPKIILEGTRLTFKTELAFTLNEHPRIVGPRKYRYHSPIISAEWCAFTNFPWGRGLINFNDDEESMALETYATWIRLFELQRYYSWIIDRFHVSTIAYQKIYRDRHYDFTWLEERLKQLNFRLIYCYRSAESFAQAREERLKVSGNPKQYDDLSIFIKEQKIIEDIIDHSLLPVFKMDMSTHSVSNAADAIADWLEATGGLYLNF